MEALTDACAVSREQSEGKSILLFDDLYRSGATVSAIRELLKNEGEVKAVSLLTPRHFRINLQGTHAAAHGTALDQWCAPTSKVGGTFEKLSWDHGGRDRNLLPYNNLPPSVPLTRETAYPIQDEELDFPRRKPCFHDGSWVAGPS
jgi:hypothetical protein